jgi:pimeloyl-ACP methyl ester carboxylesterase
MRFTSETTSNGVSERLFTLNDIPGVLWLPADAASSRSLVLLGHGGGQHKKTQGLVARAHRYVTARGFAVAAIDAPGHGDRPKRGPGSNGRENNALPGHSLDGAASDAEPDVAADLHIRCFRGHYYRDPSSPASTAAQRSGPSY